MYICTVYVLELKERTRKDRTGKTAEVTHTCTQTDGMNYSIPGDTTSYVYVGYLLACFISTLT